MVTPKLPSLLLLLVVACASHSDVPLPAGAFVVQDEGLSEMSGLEASPTHPGVLWSINDSGNRPTLFRVGTKGESLGRVKVRGAILGDWETLAFWKEGDKTWLLIGDVGDNRGWRSHVRVYAVPEPGPNDTVVDVAWKLSFRYPDGARDAEGIAVDARDQSLLVLSKRDKPARLYRVPLSARGMEEPVNAQFLTTVSVSRDRPFPARPTGLDVSKDGSRMAVLTYKGLFVWNRSPGEAWATALARDAAEVVVPRMAKAEAMSFGAEQDVLFVGSERLPAPLMMLTIE